MEAKDSALEFCFQLPDVLESERVRLTPFITDKHAKLFVKKSLSFPEIYDYLPFGPFENVEEFTTKLIDARFRPNIGYTLFVIWDKTRMLSPNQTVSGAMAGIIGLINTSLVNLSTEIGCVVILPPFQRTHVASNAVGLLLQYTLNLPHHNPGRLSLGLRRICWQANSSNAGSIRLAERMQFRREGTLRWDRVLPALKTALNVGNGKTVRQGDPRSGCVGRDTVLLGLCWDDWEDGARDTVESIMKRTR